jgi:Spx/MgsR family transcriptional regulator
MVVYGIPNCNTVKKALDWLKANKIAYEFHDFKKLGISETKLKAWSKQVGWQQLVNKKGTTWRLLDSATQETITTEMAAIALMKEKTSVIKRPVLETENGILLGFDEALYSQKFL